MPGSWQIASSSCSPLLLRIRVPQALVNILTFQGGKKKKVLNILLPSPTVQSPFLAHRYRAPSFQTVIKTEHTKKFFWQISFCPPCPTHRFSEYIDHVKYKNCHFSLKNIIVWSVLMGLFPFLHSCSAVTAPIQNIKTQFNSFLCLWRLKPIFLSSQEAFLHFVTRLFEETHAQCLE